MILYDFVNHPLYFDNAIQSHNFPERTEKGGAMVGSGMGGDWGGFEGAIPVCADEVQGWEDEVGEGGR